jgi:hypothetical protein
MLTHDVLQTILCLCEEADSPRSVGIAICLRYNEMDQLVNLDLDPARYSCSNQFFRDALVTDILRKCQGLDTSRDLQAAAVQSFWQTEQECYKSNERLSPYLFGLSSPDVNGRIVEIISSARKYLARLLGACPILPEGRFGPGATFADRGKFTTVPDKMSSTPTLTSSALGVLPYWGRTKWAFACAEERGQLEIVRGNRFTTVPKDSKKDRGICIEPSLNVFYQLGYGRAMRDRLKRVGIDLEFGQEKHRALARAASARGHLATIDLSNASDTICSNLVKLLLPDSWFMSLNQLRATHTFLPKKGWVRLEKFSSMGNGFTFELETLIFLSLIWAVMAANGHLPKEGENLLVYGDDIIIPTTCFSDVIGCLRFFGFTPNAKKSFAFGSFRESCGGDYFDGRPVRAFFLKELPSEPHQWIAFANGLRRVVADHHFFDGDFRCHFSAWHAALRSIPSNVRNLRGPAALGDILIHDHSSKWRPKSRSISIRSHRGRMSTHFLLLGDYSPATGDGIRYFRAWMPSNSRFVGWQHFRPTVTLATALYGVGDGRRGVLPRGCVTGYAERWVSYS